ncbi:unnamed protein product [Zymoseptoria tritici ST99CH_1A5]|uniref:Zn(2)-C6 fungal-type domain-containing protein n=2 Tax=Zymoseptoria tritici TaxID=1047171 RepID=A0A1X7RJD7_ZYMT9|nr:unnamed protein product [Zymoseptoria tritici ST99CH_3D7]SMY21221.1 unnamed protein product [Zymoseptoria tritici ST99CH_1A5]
MAGQGTGPSRRSHTKSRKGCKTCKRRHIRCDETFPQCRNCTKHQVRCDYMDSVESDTEGQHSPEQQSLLFSDGSDSQIEHWAQTGIFPFPSLQVFPPPQPQDYSMVELRLIYHLCTISNDLKLKGTSGLTLWAQRVPKFLSIASSYPYVMQALLSFSANHLAWSQSSDEFRNLHIHYGTIALRGLHEAIGNFSHVNADAVLAASLLLLWQATDWQSWSSLRAGIRSVLLTMHLWKHESIFAEYVDEDDLSSGAYPPRKLSHSQIDRHAILSTAIHSLQQLQHMISTHEAEAYWTGQLLSYMQRLHASTPAQNADESFSHLYLLRKWLFWIPSLLLQRQGGQGPAMLTLAHFYATALALEPLYPDLGATFCARMSLAPLEAIVLLTNAMQSQSMDQTSIEIATFMNYPQHMASHFRNSIAQQQTNFIKQESPHLARLTANTLDYTSIGNMSPAFAPLALHQSTGTSRPTPVVPSSSTSSSSTAYLDIGDSHSGFSLGTQNWGVAPSPGFPASDWAANVAATTTQAPANEQLYDYSNLGGFRGGTPANDYYQQQQRQNGAGPSNYQRQQDP